MATCVLTVAARGLSRELAATPLAQIGQQADAGAPVLGEVQPSSQLRPGHRVAAVQMTPGEERLVEFC
jgi:hypothetical protein